jgi:peptide deformylase
MSKSYVDSYKVCLHQGWYASDGDGAALECAAEARGDLKHIIQHEMDHLDGIVFTDLADSKTYLKKQSSKK